MNLGPKQLLWLQQHGEIKRSELFIEHGMIGYYRFIPIPREESLSIREVKNRNGIIKRILVR